MADRLDPGQRSALMARIGRRDTAPELATRRILHAQGFRFRVQVRKLPGTPDIVLARHRKIVLVHGCFWHGHEGCRRGALPETRHDWWAAKIEANRERDAATVEKLRELGWDVLVVWECETKDVRKLGDTLASFMAKPLA